MGLSLAVLAALFYLLPGAAFVFGLNRMVVTAKQSPLDAQLSENLAIALVSALMLDALWYAAWRNIAEIFGVAVPDAKLALSLFLGDASNIAARQAIESIGQYPIRIATYFFSLTSIGYFFGVGLSEVWKKSEGALWGTLLSPPDVSLIWMTADVKFGSDSFLIAGHLRDYALNRDGELDRVVLGGAVKRRLHPAISSAQGSGTSSAIDDKQVVIGNWKLIPGEFVVLRMRDTCTVNIDYLYEDALGDEKEGGEDDIPAPEMV